MSADRDTVLRIYCALLSRDPLAQQRFTQIGERFEQLAHLAHAAAEQFASVESLWQRDPKRAEQLAQQRWDIRAISVEPKIKAQGGKVGMGEDVVLPKSQGDLLGEMQ